MAEGLVEAGGMGEGPSEYRLEWSLTCSSPLH
jgi:hypothetical protein